MEEIHKLPGIAKVSHFYSDYNFTHEIFANMPQRIILIEDQIDEQGFLSHILATGQCPFVLVNQGDNMNQLMDQHYQEVNFNPPRDDEWSIYIICSSLLAISLTIFKFLLSKIILPI